MNLLLGAALLPPLVMATMVFPDCSNGPLASNGVCDLKASPIERAASLVAAMGISDKLQNLVNGAAGAPSLGLPPYEWWSEALHGVAQSRGVAFAPKGEFSSATSFANPILMSAAFDDELIYNVADTISTEIRAFSNAGRAGLDVWTPNINPYKDPRWGRGMETPGEDPFRIKGYVKALLRGLEHRTSESNVKVLATCKHYAGYDLEDWEGVSRYGFDAIISMQDLTEYYLPPFQECARDSKVSSIMCSYNAINGTPTCADTYLMGDILRQHWEWTGDHNYITSDCNAVECFYTAHNYTATAAEAAGMAITSGTDTICEVSKNTNVTGAYSEGDLDVAAIDQALTRLYTNLVRVGYFDPSSSEYRSLGWNDVNTKESQALALQSAEAGIVLKKNDGLLPMNLKGKKVAVIGHWANATDQMLGGYSGIPPYYHNPLVAAKTLGLETFYAPGPVAENSSVPDNWTAPALAAAKKADVVLYFGGNDLTVERESLDRTSISLPSSQADLIKKLANLGKPLVVAQLGGQDDDTMLLDNPHVNAILWAGYPGQDGGTAVFNVISGDTAPAGRLPVTQYPAEYVDQVAMTNMDLRRGDSNPGRTYMWYNNSVLPFGYGLHYTEFKASFSSRDLHSKTFNTEELVKQCSKAHKDLCPFASIDVIVKNLGKVKSDFVALAFLSGEYGPKPFPLKTLTAYSRVKSIRPGCSKRINPPISLGNLARADSAGNTVLYPGLYSVLLDVPTQDKVTFTIVGKPVVLDEFPQPRK